MPHPMPHPLCWSVYYSDSIPSTKLPRFLPGSVLFSFSRPIFTLSPDFLQKLHAKMMAVFNLARITFFLIFGWNLCLKTFFLSLLHLLSFSFISITTESQKCYRYKIVKDFTLFNLTSQYFHDNCLYMVSLWFHPLLYLNTTICQYRHSLNTRLHFGYIFCMSTVTTTVITCAAIV